MCVCVCVCVCVVLTVLGLGSREPLSAAPGGSLQQLPEVVLEDGRVQVVSLAAQDAAGRLGALKVHKLPPAHWSRDTGVMERYFYTFRFV